MLDQVHDPADARFLEDLYAEWQARMLANPAYGMEDLRDIFEEWHRPTLEPEDVRYRSGSIAPGMQHVFPCLAGRARIADDELASVASWYRSRMAAQRAK